MYLNSVPIVAWETIHRAGLTFQLLTSSPWYPQSNGQAEQTVQTVKRLLTKSTDRYWAIVQLLTLVQPQPSWASDGETNQDNSPFIRWAFDPQVVLLGGGQETMMSTKESRNDSLTSVVMWMSSRYQMIWMSGLVPKVNLFRRRVVSSADTLRSYVLDTPSGQLRRNHHHLTPLPGPSPVTQPLQTTE